MAQNYGNTWWGKEWLRSLDNIDFNNRLPRGASYARREMVKKVSINDNSISAKVSGSGSRPYNINIVIPPFFPEQITPFIDELIKYPVIISKLLNRELDPEILNIASKLGLVVFPRQWSDFKMACSCPDWAVPCKHLAAVIYIISREIDNNPFLVFEMHKINLLDELAKRGINIEEKKTIQIIKLKEIIDIKREETLPLPTQNDAYNKVNLAQLYPIGDALNQIPMDNPPFYPAGNFKFLYNKELTAIIKKVDKFMRKNQAISTLFPSYKTASFSITYNCECILSLQQNYDWDIQTELQQSINKHSFLATLLEINPDRILDYTPSIAALYQLAITSIHLLANGAIIPQLIELQDKSVIIRWLPAMTDKTVAEIMGKLERSIPLNLIKTYRSNKTIANQAQLIISLILNTIIKNLYNNYQAAELQKLFFAGDNLKFDNIGQQETAGSIKAWLDRFYITQRDTQISLLISENKTNNNFHIDIEINNPTQSQENIPLSDILSNPQNLSGQFEILQPLSMLSSFIKGLDFYINNGAKTPIVMNNQEFAPFLIDILPIIRLLNINILLPKSLQQLLRPKATVKLKQKNSESFISLTDMFSFDWQIAIGDDIMSIEQFEKLMGKASKLLKFKQQYIYVNEEDIAKIYKQLSASKTLSPIQLLQTALTEEFNGAPILLTDQVKEIIKQFTSQELIPLPKDLCATLRPYQIRGFSWLYKNLKIGFGSVLADDMGLGKTIQVITLLLKLYEEEYITKKQKAIIIAPTGLLTNWLKEINRFAPSLPAQIYHGTNRNITNINTPIVITTYGTIRNDINLLKRKKWQAVIIDEAQNIKNHDTAQTKAVKALGASLKIAMSGTPVENRLSEFWSIMDFANKGYLGNINSFKEQYAIPIQLNNDTTIINRFKNITAPFMMRRLKTDKTIISDLPDKIEQNLYAQLTAQQTAIYQETLNVAMNSIEEFSESEQVSLFKRQGLILQMILALKQICNHPVQFLKNEQTDVALSGKAMVLLDLVESIVESNEKVLIFTQYKEMGQLLQTYIANHLGQQPMFYHGGCTIKEREDMVTQFQSNRKEKVFILSLKAAGTGLNLTAASHVIHYDLWWNPAVEAQATDRAYRIGQHKNVQVYRFITQDTFEERIDAMIQSKRHLAEMTVATGENWLGKLSNKELREIFQ